LAICIVKAGSRKKEEEEKPLTPYVDLRCIPHVIYVYNHRLIVGIIINCRSASRRIKDACSLPRPPSRRRTETLETHAETHEETHEGRCKSPLRLQTGNARKGLIRMTRKVHSSPAAVIFLARARRERERERERGRGGGEGGEKEQRWFSRGVCTLLCKPHLFKMSHRLPAGVFFSFFLRRSVLTRVARARKSDASSCRAIRIHRRRIIHRKMD